MDIIEKPIFMYNYDIKNILIMLRFKNEPIKIVGSFVIEHIIYYSDIDIMSNIKQSYSSQEAYDEYCKILKNVLNTQNLYLIEIKIQTDNKKIRFYPDDQFNFIDFDKVYDDIDFVKFDLVAFIDNKFIEMSILYGYAKPPTRHVYIKSIEADMNQLIKEKSYFKALKRVFLISKLKNDIHITQTLIKFFNKMGSKSNIYNNLKAIELVKTYYNDDFTNKRIDIYLKELIIKVKIITKTINSTFKSLNKNANNYFLNK